MALFNKKTKSTATIQDIQTEFNQAVFELGDLNYRKHMVKQELTRIEAEIQARTQKADKLGLQAQKLRHLVKDEVKAAINGQQQAPAGDDEGPNEAA